MSRNESDTRAKLIAPALHVKTEHVVVAYGWGDLEYTLENPLDGFWRENEPRFFVVHLTGGILRDLHLCLRHGAGKHFSLVEGPGQAGSEFFLLPSSVLARPHAGNANRWAEYTSDQ